MEKSSCVHTDGKRREIIAKLMRGRSGPFGFLEKCEIDGAQSSVRGRVGLIAKFCIGKFELESVRRTLQCSSSPPLHPASDLRAQVPLRIRDFCPRFN